MICLKEDHAFLKSYRLDIDLERGGNIKGIPNYLECAYCLRNRSHGGECVVDKYNNTGCLAFKPDPRGCIREIDLKIPIPLYHDIPPLEEWCDYWTVNERDTEIRIKKIRALKWDAKSGYLIIHCSCQYYINEYAQDYQEPKSKPKLKLIK